MLKAEIKIELQGQTSTPIPIRCLTQWNASWEANYTEVTSSISLGKDAWAIFFFSHGAALHQKVLQCRVKSGNEGIVNPQWKMNTFSLKSISFLGFSNIIMIYKSYSIIVETSLNCFSHSKIMTAVTSHLCLQGWSVRCLQALQRTLWCNSYCMDRLTSQHLCVHIFCIFPFISFLG